VFVAIQLIISEPTQTLSSMNFETETAELCHFVLFRFISVAVNTSPLNNLFF